MEETRALQREDPCLRSSLALDLKVGQLLLITRTLKILQSTSSSILCILFHFRFRPLLQPACLLACLSACLRQTADSFPKGVSGGASAGARGGGEREWTGKVSLSPPALHPLSGCFRLICQPLLCCCLHAACRCRCTITDAIPQRSKPFQSLSPHVSVSSSAQGLRISSLGVPPPIERLNLRRCHCFSLSPMIQLMVVPRM